MLFIDRAKIYLTAGNGGNGCVSFRRERYVPRGGPDGGSGGKGGDIYLVATNEMLTLADFLYKPHFKAEDGKHGKGKNQTGESGKDLIIKVPCGTLVYKNDKFICDLVKENEKVLIASGGEGGRGNASFKSSTNRAPKIAEKGKLGEKCIVELELKLIADVGIIGYPNAGKSTLLSVLTPATPKIADYPFTTLVPNLGVLKYGDEKLILADVPGLIEGASRGKGLGIDFLRHIDRTRILIHLVDISGYDGKTAFENFILLNNELKNYSRNMLNKPMIVALNKIDLPNSDEKIKDFMLKFKKYNRKNVVNIIPISCLTRRNLNELIVKCFSTMSKVKNVKKRKDIMYYKLAN